MLYVSVCVSHSHHGVSEVWSSIPHSWYHKTELGTLSDTRKFVFINACTCTQIVYMNVQMYNYTHTCTLYMYICTQMMLTHLQYGWVGYYSTSGGATSFP